MLHIKHDRRPAISNRLFLLLVSVIALSSFTTEAEQASLNGNVLSIPVVVVGNITYSIDLTIVPNTEPIKFSLSAAAEVFDVSTVGASSFAGGILSIPAVPVGDVSYWAELTLVDQALIIFQLSGAGINDESTIAQTFFSEQVSSSIVQTKCIVCHFQGGLATSTGLLFVNASNADHLQINNQVFATFLEQRAEGPDYILSKVRGGDGHQGGVQLASSNPSFAVFEEYLGLLSGASDDGNEQTSVDFWADIQVATARKTLHRAAIILTGRIPTETEYSLAETGDAGLRGAIRKLMQGDGFHQFLIEGSNDRLLTDKWLIDPGVIDPNVDYYVDLMAALSAVYNSEGQSATQELRIRMNYGFARQPLELIAYVVENDRVYTEILTAEYTMVNPAANVAFRAGAVFNDPEDATEFQPGTVNDYVLMDSEFTMIYPEGNAGLAPPYVTSHSGYVDYPHAGVLNTEAYLSRYPSTETNRNRARARWTYYHFLGVDIEKSASRPTDPEALTDTNNPTLNNSNCTVCHEVMDPVAGAFQNYGDVGKYRSQYGGLDSLSDAYKYPTMYGLDDRGPYQHGDLWYRDMRLPGFNGKVVPDGDTSLQWLANEIVNDPRFATATVQFWWPALMGIEALLAPQNSSDIDYEVQLTAFEQQQLKISSLAEGFRQGSSAHGAYNLRDLLVEMIMTNWFRLDRFDAVDTDRTAMLQAVGTERLLTPKQLERKSTSLTGYTWGENFWNQGHRQTNLGTLYNIYYGGIDSLAITRRKREMTSLMSSVVAFHALESSCLIVAKEFELPDGERSLFNNFSIDDDTPDSADPSAAGSLKVQNKLIELHDMLLAEALTVDDEELQASYQLFLDVLELNQDDGPHFIRSIDCNPVYLGLDSGVVNYDPHNLKSAWQALMVYFMTDHRFLYE